MAVLATGRAVGFLCACVSCVGLLALAEFDQAESAGPFVCWPLVSRFPLDIQPILPKSLAQMHNGESLDVHFTPEAMSGSAEVVPSLSQCLHMLRVRGAEAEFSTGVIRSSSDAVHYICRAPLSNAVFGGSLCETRHGIRFRPAIDLAAHATLVDEVHRHHVLAEFSELRIPLATPVQLPDEQVPSKRLRDALMDLVANYHSADPEIAWTAVALINYLPPCRTWVNKHGMRFTFEDLATALMARDLRKESCWGTHVFYAMVRLLRAQRIYRLLGEVKHDELRNRVGTLVETTLAGMRQDGSLAIDWFESGDHDEASYLATGHLAEFSLYLPSELQWPEERTLLTARWLHSETSRKLSAGDIKTDFCALSHAACFLKHLYRNK